MSDRQKTEYCTLVYEEENLSGQCTLISYTEDGAIRKKVRRDTGGVGLVVAELDREGWAFVFRDRDGPIAQIFFKRDLP
jgi:hypothetical protein